MIGKNLSINGKIISSFAVVCLVLGIGFVQINQQNNIVLENIAKINMQSSATASAGVDASEINTQLKAEIDDLSATLQNALSEIELSATEISTSAENTQIATIAVKNSVNEILSESIPVIDLAKEVNQSISDMAKNIGFYLLTKEDADKTLFSESIKSTQSLVDQLANLDAIMKDDEAMEQMPIILNGMEQLADIEATLIMYATNRAKNMPSVEFASTQLNPRNRSITSILSSMIDGGGASESDDANADFVKILIEMRHYQVSAAGDVRAYLALRNSAIDSADQLYQSVKDGLVSIIAMIDEDDELVDMEFEESFEKLKDDINFITGGALAELKKQHSSDSWRKDIHTVNTKVNPIITELSEAINEIIDLQNDDISMKQANMEASIVSTEDRIINMTELAASQGELVTQSTNSLNSSKSNVDKKTTMTTSSMATIQQKADAVVSAAAASKSAMDSVGQIVLFSLLATLIAIIVIIVLIKKSVANPIKASVDILNNIADGNLNDDISPKSTDEVGQLMIAMLKIKDNLTSFNAELSETVDKAKSGDLTVAINAEAYKGYMGEQADQVNYLVHAVKTTLDGVNESLSGLANGNLDVEMDLSHYEGQFKDSASSVNNTLGNIGNLVTGVQEVVEMALQGDLSHRVPEDGKQGFELEIADSINNLMEVQDQVFKDITDVITGLASKDMTRLINNNLSGTYANIRDNNNIAQQELSDTFGEIATAAIKVAESSNKMNEGNAELAARSEQQASYLEETSSAMEEFTASIQTNATNAKNASQVSEKASTTTKEGGVAVQEVADTVSEVSEAFEEIASIVGIIDDIAFQTNILALNAAVEAARAGDHGRGFAVVAQEVRNLAQRSAESAKNIKGLVDTRAKSVSMATQLATKAGETMSEIEKSINEVNSLIQEISIASSEQSDGVAQVNDAISRLDEMTQQNSHLVDGNNLVAQSLDLQSKELKAQVMDFEFIGKEKVGEITETETDSYSESSDKDNGLFDPADTSFVEEDFNENPFNKDL
jgi:methyl-accepting chemotaxis protein